MEYALSELLAKLTKQRLCPAKALICTRYLPSAVSTSPWQLNSLLRKIFALGALRELSQTFSLLKEKRAQMKMLLQGVLVIQCTKTCSVLNECDILGRAPTHYQESNTPKRCFCYWWWWQEWQWWWQWRYIWLESYPILICCVSVHL